MDIAEITTRTARPRLGTWLFLACTAGTVAGLRLEGRAGDGHRTIAMRELCKVYGRASINMFLHSRNGEIAGVAYRGPDGDIVAVYYGPGDARNTRLDWPGYSLQHRLVTTEELLPLHQRRRSANDLHINAYMPVATRDTRRNQ